MEQSDQHSTKQTSKTTGFNLMILGFVTVVVLALVTGGYAILSKQNSSGNIPSLPTPVPAEQNQINPKIWTKPISTKKGYPLVKSLKNGSGNLSIYSFSTKEIRKLPQTVTAEGGASGFGSTQAVSPNLLYTAFIDDKNNNLWIVSHESLDAKQITLHGGVSYISAWSPDSKQLIYYLTKNTITTKTQEYGGLQKNKVKFNPQLDYGFFLFNIESGETKKLYPVDYIETFIDSENILVRADDQYENDNLIVFNINTFEADYGYVKEKFGFGAGQFNFSKDGIKWVYTLSRNPTNDANIIFTSFPQKEGEVIEAGSWADVQFPFLSPQDTQIAYQKKDGYIRNGVPRLFVWTYTIASKQKKKYVEGWPVQWVDENSLLFRKYEDPDNFVTSLNLLDLTTDSVTKID